MKNETIYIALINIFIFYLLWFWGFRHYFIHSFRHELFTLRDKLLDYAKSGNISFDDSAFLTRWNQINSMIRHANDTHPLFFTSAIVAGIDSTESEKYRIAYEKEIQGLSESQKMFMQNIRKEQMKLFLFFLIKSSLVLFGIGLISGIILFFKAKMADMKVKKKVSIVFEPYFEAYNEVALNTL